MARVYVETSVISYLTARPSTNIIVAAHQHLTRRWWNQRDQFELLTSELVLEEASLGDPALAKKRLALLEELHALGITDEASALAHAILRASVLPAKAFADALHISTAAVHSLDYLVTWNCSHIANAQLLPRVRAVVEKAGYPMTFVCTPEELLGEDHD